MHSNPNYYYNAKLSQIMAKKMSGMCKEGKAGCNQSNQWQSLAIIDNQELIEGGLLTKDRHI